MHGIVSAKWGPWTDVSPSCSAHPYQPKQRDKLRQARITRNWVYSGIAEELQFRKREFQQAAGGVHQSFGAGRIYRQGVPMWRKEESGQSLSRKFIGLRMRRESWWMFTGPKISPSFPEVRHFKKEMSLSKVLFSWGCMLWHSLFHSL